MTACTCDLCVIRARMERERPVEERETEPLWVPSNETLLARAMKTHAFKQNAFHIHARTGMWPTPVVRGEN